MNTPESTCGFRQIPPRTARLWLATALLATIYFMAIAVSPLASGFADKASRGAGDVELYQAEMRRIAAGEGYYEAAGQELRSRGYPTTSPFNWRTPLPMWLLGNMPSEVFGRLAIGGLAGLVLLLGCVMVARETDRTTAMLAGLLLIGALMPCWLGEIYIMPVVWAGVLIALSVCLYSMDLRAWAFGAGLSALFVRELAAPYCVVCLLMAIKERKHREVVAWSTGLGLYAVFYAWHAAKVMSMVGPNEAVHATSWLQFGGAAFVISLAQLNAYLLLLPQWFSAIYLALALIGFASWNSAAGYRAGLTVCAFVGLFAVVGQPFNQYWGSLMAPLLCFGVARAPGALAELFRQAVSDESKPAVASG